MTRPPVQLQKVAPRLTPPQDASVLGAAFASEHAPHAPPGTALKRPAPHCTQLVLPEATTEVEPASHGVQAAAPALEEKKPAAQSVHTPPKAENCPAEQGVQRPEDRDAPAGHADGNGDGVAVVEATADSVADDVAVVEAVAVAETVALAEAAVETEGVAVGVKVGSAGACATPRKA